MLSSRRARCMPKHRCEELPNAKWPGLRLKSTSLGFVHASGPREVIAVDIATLSPGIIFTPLNSVLRSAERRDGIDTVSTSRYMLSRYHLKKTINSCILYIY